LSLTLQNLLETHVHTLAPVLHPGMADALAKVSKRLAGIDRTQHAYLYSLTIKADLRTYCAAQDLGPWSLDGNPRLHGQTHLVIPEHGIRMKVMKENRHVHPGGIPPANRTKPDRFLYTDIRSVQEALAFELEQPVWPAGRPIDMLLLWDYPKGKNGAVLHDAFTLRAVHTTAPGAFGHVVPTDLSFDITSPTTVFAKSRFAGDAADDDLYSYQIDTTGEMDAN
jgi:hypothetical protein